MFSLKKLFAPPAAALQAHEAYVVLVAQARKPVFYAAYGVADSLDGRFDVIVLHLFLLIHRLRRDGSADTPGFIRALSEAFFADMDRSLREMGVGDTGISRRVKAMAQAFYGRLQAYEQGIASMETLKQALARNLYRDAPVDEAQLQAVADYMLQTAATFDAQPAADLMNGMMVFG